MNTEKPLVEYIDQFLCERIALDSLPLSQVTWRWLSLVESANLRAEIGYVQFLSAFGEPEATLAHLTSHFIGRYFEFTIGYYGVHQSRLAMDALREFWIWCRDKKLTVETEMPPDLKTYRPRHSYVVEVTITEHHGERRRS